MALTKELGQGRSVTCSLPAIGTGGSLILRSVPLETSNFNQYFERLPNEEVICHFSAQMKMGYSPEETSPYHAPCHAQIVPHQTLWIPDRSLLMSQLDRITRINALLSTRRVVPRTLLLEELEVSPATLKRDIAFLRDAMNTPIVWDRELDGYRLDPSQTTGPQLEVPSMWFSDKEIHAILTMQHLLANLGPGGLLAPHVEPLMTRLNAMLSAAEDPTEEIRRRVLIVGVGQRSMKLAHFENIGVALLRRQRLRIRYFARGRGEESEREISPQRLVHYRENWYLDAWCHLRNELRSFALDAIRRAEILDDTARDIDDATLDRVLGSGYGIFAGADVEWAVLHFSAERSRWVAQEKWHPDQQGRPLPDGGFELRVPYSQPPELLMDILRHGRHVQVISPAPLREAVRAEHAAAAQINSR